MKRLFKKLTKNIEIFEIDTEMYPLDGEVPVREEKPVESEKSASKGTWGDVHIDWRDF